MTKSSVEIRPNAYLSWYGGKTNPKLLPPRLSGANLDGLDCFDRLGQDIRGAIFIDCSFCSASLELMYTSRTTFVRCDLRGAKLSGCDFNLADLSGCDLRGADLQLADLRGANLCGADLRGAKLNGAEFGYFGDLMTDISLMRASPEDLKAILAALSEARPTPLTKAQALALANYKKGEKNATEKD